MCNNKIHRSAIWRDDLTHQEKWWVSQEPIVVVPKGETKWERWLQNWDSLTVYAVIGNQDGSWSLKIMGTEYWDDTVSAWLLDYRALDFARTAPGYRSNFELVFSTADEAVKVAQEIL